MKKGLTEIVFILDESGSMCGLEKDTIGGYNSFITKQKKVEGEAFVTAITFSDNHSILHDRRNIKDVGLLCDGQYNPGGCTALLDAVGFAIEHIKTIHKYARKEDVPEKTVFVITTDGEENSSREYSYEKVKTLIEEQKKECNWEFLFLGANIDAIAEAAKIGISSKYAVSYECDEIGTKTNFDAVSDAMCCYRMTSEKSISDDWKDKIVTYKKESKKKRRS